MEEKRGEFLTGSQDGLCGFLLENLSVKPITFSLSELASNLFCLAGADFVSGQRPLGREKG